MFVIFGRFVDLCCKVEISWEEIIYIVVVIVFMGLIVLGGVMVNERK